jgi:hypothetical protein
MTSGEADRSTNPQVRSWIHGAWGSLAVFALASLAQLPLADSGHVALDEGQITMIGSRLLNGEFLYRDVYTGIFPGIYWITEVLFRMFGVDILVTRYAQLVFNALLAVSVWRVSLRLASPSAAWIAALAYVALVYASFPGLSFLSYSTVSLLCAMEAALAACSYAATGRTRDGIRCGLLLAATTVVKQNYGVLALFSIAAGLAWSRPYGPLARRSLAEAAMPVIASGLAVAAVAGGYLYATGSFGFFWEYTVLTLFGTQLTAYNQPMAPLFGEHTIHDGIFVFLYTPGILFCYLLIGIPVTARAAVLDVISVAVRFGYGAAWLALLSAPYVLWTRIQRDRKGEANARPSPARILVPFSFVMFFGIFPSAIWSHLAAVLPGQIPLLAALGDDVARALTSGRHLRPMRRLLGPAMAGLVTVVFLAGFAKISIDVRKWNPRAFGVPHASLRVSDRDWHMFNAALTFLNDCARDDDTIFVAPDMPILYVATGKKNPTPYDLVVPGDVRDEVMVREIEAAGTRCVVLADMMYPQFQRFDVLFPKLDAHLRESYAVQGSVTFEKLRWEFLVRRSGG